MITVPEWGPAAQQALMLMNQYGRQRIPFLFVLDYALQQPLVVPLTKAADEGIFYRVNELTNHTRVDSEQIEPVHLRKFPLSFAEYERSFNLVQAHLRQGNSFLVNLTKPTPIEVNLSLRSIFERSQAQYSLLFRDQFTLFSPETFVQIRAGRLSSHPMKGTISAHVPNAHAVILADPKEQAEHATIVDLIRNDISLIADKVWVERFRYVERITTQQGDLLQVSSEICGSLPASYPEQIGTLLFQMLPAGSITGAPKAQTLAIIREAEGYDRGYYTGVFGIFDGQNLDSAVMIRFIEQTLGGLVFKSGGGITAYANAEAEYQELIDKVYLPL